MRNTSLAGALALSLSFTIGPALAQGDAGAQPAEEPASSAPPAADADQARADKLFEEGRTLMAEGKYDLACAKFQKSHELRPGIGVLFNLADCNEKRGKLGTAYTQFVEVAERTKAALQTDREKIARERVTKLEGQIMRLRVIVPSLAKVRAVLLDGKPLDPKDYGQTLVVDPGEHTITAKTTSDAGEPFEETVELDEPGEVVTVTIPVTPGAKMRRNVGMIIGGGITAGVGVLMLGGAVAVAANNPDNDGAGAAVGLGVLSLVHMAVGFPIFGVGFRKRPVYDAGLPTLVASPVPEIQVGPTGGSLTWRF